MFDQLKLRGFFGFVTGDPVAVMKVFSLQRAVVGAGTVAVVEDELFVIGLSHGRPRTSMGPLPEPKRENTAVKAQALGRHFSCENQS